MVSYIRRTERISQLRITPENIEYTGYIERFVDKMATVKNWTIIDIFNIFNV